jgi:hypothetical protein
MKNLAKILPPILALALSASIAAQNGNDVLEGIQVTSFSNTKVWTEVKNGSLEKSQYAGIQRTGQKEMIQPGNHLRDLITKKFDPESFLLGTLDDYMGRIPSDDQVDTYRQQDKTLALFIDTLFSRTYPDLYLTDSGAPKGLTLHSPQLSKAINACYDYETGPGTLKADKFPTKKQKTSFLAGTILRYGILNTNKSGVYCIALPNSHSKAGLCEHFLKELGCKNVEYHIQHGHIPAGHLVYFQASSKIHKIIRNLEHTGP